MSWTLRLLNKRLWKGKQSNQAVEKPSRHHLNQVIKGNMTSEKFMMISGIPQRDMRRRAPHLFWTPSLHPTSINSCHFPVVNFLARQILTGFPFTLYSSGNKTDHKPITQIPGGFCQTTLSPSTPTPQSNGRQGTQNLKRVPNRPCFSLLQPSLRSNGEIRGSSSSSNLQKRKKKLYFKCFQ